MPDKLNNFQSGIEELQEDSDELLKKVQELLTLLVKTLKIFCIYPSDNPIPKEFKNNLFKKLVEFLEKYEELKIQVDQSKLIFRDKIILQEEKKDEGISFALYRDGIREITFLSGIEQDELDSILEIISCCIKSNLPEDDMVTLFWEKELAHIKFLVVDEFLSEELSDLPQTIGDNDLKKVYYSEIELDENEEKSKGIPHKIEIDRFVHDLDLIPEKELKELKTLVEKDKKFEPLKELFLILREIFWGEKELQEFLETVNILEKLLDSLVSQGDFYLASEMLLMLKEVEKFNVEKAQSNRSERIKDTINRAGDNERIKTLTRVLNQDLKMDLYTAGKYISLLNLNSIPHLVDMLAELEHFPARRMVCRVLENAGEKNIDLLGKGVYDRRWYVVRNIVWVLGRIGSPVAIPYLKKTIAHLDIRVRKETLQALSNIEGGEVTKILLRVLEDSEERFRIEAAKLLSKKQDQAVIDSVSSILCRKDFRDKSKTEKEALLQSWVEINKDKAISLLKKLILKRTWIKREKQRETSSLALKALASVNTSLAQDSLKELSARSSRKIRQQAKSLWEKVSIKSSENIQKSDLS
ncbi:MAG: HEAT repeat domain-containing protein [candidate division Zixibacteria bacterium]|nr:HEAT repeat domain-containing protein [candidate division Zixibacteria bacterium]